MKPTFLLLILLTCSCSVKKQAPPVIQGLQLSTSSTISRIAFGSCSNQNYNQPILKMVVNSKPDVFIYLGDNIYGDTENMTLLQEKYDQLALKPEFQQLKRTVPLLAVWDDHDYGTGDGGKNYPFRKESKDIFLNFFDEPLDSKRWKHEGIYHSLVFGEKGKRLQVILLDTRTFKDDLESRYLWDQGKNDYLPTSDSTKTMIGKQQWEWLDKQFEVDAEVRLIASSTQFAHDYNGWESWNNYPHEKQKILQLIKKKKAEGVVFISGDVHWAELSKINLKDAYPIYDLTSSGITETWDKLEPNKNRIGKAFMGNNFGSIQIDWEMNDPSITFSCFDVQKSEVIHHQINLSELRFQY